MQLIENPMNKGSMSKLVRFFVTFLVLVLLCSVPLMKGLYSDCKAKVIVERTGSTMVPISNQKVSQEIYLQGSLKQLYIYFHVAKLPNPQDTVSITLDQGSLHVERQLLLSSLVSDDFNQIKGDYSGFQKGSVMLSVMADSTDQTEVYCAVSSTLISGLPAAVNADSTLNGPLQIQYNIFKINHYFVYDTVLFTLLLLVLFFTSWLLVFKKELLDKKNYLFFCSFSIIFLSVSLNNPTAGYFGQPISEAAYEFWYKAHQFEFGRSMMTLMSGEALAWLERIMIYVADKLSASGKHVFVLAQLMELTFISAVSSMACLKAFRRYFGNEIRLLFSIFMGSLVFFINAYFFYGVSYWSAFFFIAFALLNLDELKRWQYAGGLLLTIILCVSRIYHVVLIPVCLFLLITLGKSRGRRFRILNIAAIVASTFEGVYSAVSIAETVSNAGVLQNIKNMGILKLIGNTLYYQVQMLNSLFTHQANQNGLLANMIWLFLLFALIIFALVRLFSKKHDSTIPVVIISLMLFSLGTIAMNVITSGNWASISFPISYSKEVDWTANYFQQADFHFSYAYICMGFLLMVVLYVFKNHFVSRLKTYFAPEKSSKAMLFFQRAGYLSFSFVILILGSMVAHTKVSVTQIPTEWKAVYHVTDQMAYYVPINVDYPVATISLAHNSTPMMFGFLSNGVWGRWQYGDPAYHTSTVYSKAVLGDDSDIETKGLLSICAHKALTNFETIYVAVLYDREGNEIARVPQSNSANRMWVDFMLEQPLGNVYSVAFELSSGEQAYVNNALQLGISMYALY